MRFETLGKRENPAILFFHAMGVTGASSVPIAKYLQDRYFCILPTSSVYCRGETYVSKADEIRQIDGGQPGGQAVPGTAGRLTGTQFLGIRQHRRTFQIPRRDDAGISAGKLPGVYGHEPYAVPDPRSARLRGDAGSHLGTKRAAGSAVFGSKVKSQKEKERENYHEISY